jgi:hypothetical protein
VQHDSKESQFGLEELEPRVLLSANMVALGAAGAACAVRHHLAVIQQEAPSGIRHTFQNSLGYNPAAQMEDMFAGVEHASNTKPRGCGRSCRSRLQRDPKRGDPHGYHDGHHARQEQVGGGKDFAQHFTTASEHERQQQRIKRFAVDPHSKIGQWSPRCNTRQSGHCKCRSILQRLFSGRGLPSKRRRPSRGGAERRAERPR